MPSTERVDLKQGLQLKLTFVLSEEIKDLNDTFIFLGKPDMPLMAYLNGSRMYSRGIIGDRPTLYPPPTLLIFRCLVISGPQVKMFW
jgi:hypothetical protein